MAITATDAPKFIQEKNMADLNETKVKQRIQHIAEDMAGCCEGPYYPTEPISLVEQLRTERARVSKLLAARIRKLDQAIRLLENSDAESIIRDAQSVLNE
jgi:hypothetical protein